MRIRTFLKLLGIVFGAAITLFACKYTQSWSFFRCTTVEQVAQVIKPSILRGVHPEDTDQVRTEIENYWSGGE